MIYFPERNHYLARTPFPAGLKANRVPCCSLLRFKSDRQDVLEAKCLEWSDGKVGRVRGSSLDEYILLGKQNSIFPRPGRGVGRALEHPPLYNDDDHRVQYVFRKP